MFGVGRLGRVVCGVQVCRREGVDELIRVARPTHLHLLTRHELERSVGTEVQDCVGLEDLLQVGVVNCKTVVRTGGLGKEQAHLSPSYPKDSCTPMKTLPNCFP